MGVFNDEVQANIRIAYRIRVEASPTRSLRAATNTLCPCDPRWIAAPAMN